MHVGGCQELGGGENEESPVVEVEARRGWEGPAMQVFRTETELILVAR